ncbi:hypothetical protein PoB_004671100 [Plakobranchus ocellatus]|uniref:Uncharacterized protein n=1 Tax=Plakobranchus ocellatus TaxID=259542 RepID=A0AAV4BMG6_9GAST|nr:hypothetical protein PoB_004671100 [Plakobranchus ocellatus]
MKYSQFGRRPPQKRMRSSFIECSNFTEECLFLFEQPSEGGLNARLTEEASAVILSAEALRERQAMEDSSETQASNFGGNALPNNSPGKAQSHLAGRRRARASHRTGQSQAAKIIIAVCMGAARLVHWSIV